MSRAGSREVDTQLLYCEIDGLPIDLAAEDLSMVGAFVRTTMPPLIDHELKIFLRSAIGELTATGHVVQVVDCARASREDRKPGFGFLFTDLSDDQRAFLGLTLDAVWRASKSRCPKQERVNERISETELLAERERAEQAEQREARAQALRAQASQVERELRTELASLQGKTPWTALGLDSEASIGRAKEAFLERSKRCHPHRYARHESLEVSRLATELFITYKRSYSVITKLAPRGDQDLASSSAARGRSEAPSSRSTLTSMAPAPATSATPPARSRSR